MKKYNLRLKYGTFRKDGGDGGDGGSGGSGGSADDWRDGLGDLKDNKGLKDFKDVGGLAKAYLDTKADNGRSLRIPGPDASADTISAFNADLISKVPSLVNIPGEDTSEEDVASFFTQLGKPAEASKYVQPKDMPDALKDGMNTLAARAFENNLTQDQFKRIADSMVKDNTTANDAATTLTADEYDKLKLDWGPAIQTKSQQILELAKQTGAPQSLIDAVTERKMDASTMKWLDGLVTTMSGEGSQMSFQGGGTPDDRVTPSEAKVQIEEIMARKEYWESGNAQQEGLIAKVVSLGKIASAA